MRKLFTIIFMILVATSISAQDLFFSEYIEGSSNNKAIEIYNPTGSDVDLSNYRVIRANNGGTTLSDSLVLSGSLANNDVFVIGNASAAAEILNVSDITSTLTFYNGDDFMGIQKNVDGSWVTIDAIGVFGVDPGTNWTVGATGATSEFTLVRKPEIFEGTTDWAASAGTTDEDSQWLIYPQNTFTYIGAHTMNPLVSYDLFFSEYIEGSSSNKALEIYNPTGSEVDLSNYRVIRANNGAVALSDSAVLSGTLADKDVFVIGNPSTTGVLPEIVAASDLLSTLTFYNGDDFMGLEKNVDGSWVTIDVIGVRGVDPGTNWTVGATGATSEFTLVRKPEILNGTTDWAASAGTTDEDSQWLIYPQNTVTYLGSHTVGSGGTDDSPVIASVTASAKVPAANEDLTVTAEVTDDNGLTEVLLFYTINENAPVEVAMSLNNSVYEGVIPNSAYNDGDIVSYLVTAYDGVNDVVQSTAVYFFAGTTDIADIKVFDDNIFAVYDGYYARVTGVSQADGDTYDGVGNTFGYLMGSTAAINVYFPGAVYPFVEGNSYTVTGQIDQFNGLLEIIPDDINTDITDNGFVGQVTPVVLTVAELLDNPEMYESMLVGIVGVTKTDGTWPAEGSNANLTISDDGGTTTVTLRIDKDTDIDGTTEPTWPKDVVGIFIQFDSSSPFDGGYQLLPRSTADILENGTIPVELVSFSATALDNKVKLEWTTATETNNSGFEIQKSTENSSWEKVSFVEGRGTSTEINSYVYVDNKVSAGKYSYRLKQIDFDGTVSYSSVIEVVVGVPVEYELAQNFPNPFNPTTNIRFSLPEQANVNLTVYNVLGQEVATVVNESLEAGIHNYAFDASNLNSGVYYYRIKTDNFVEVKKMMLVK